MPAMPHSRNEVKLICETLNSRLLLAVAELLRLVVTIMIRNNAPESAIPTIIPVLPIYSCQRSPKTIAAAKKGTAKAFVLFFVGVGVGAVVVV